MLGSVYLTAFGSMLWHPASIDLLLWTLCFFVYHHGCMAGFGFVMEDVINVTACMTTQGPFYVSIKKLERLTLVSGYCDLSFILIF